MLNRNSEDIQNLLLKLKSEFNRSDDEAEQVIQHVEEGFDRIRRICTRLISENDVDSYNFTFFDIRHYQGSFLPEIKLLATDLLSKVLIDVQRAKIEQKIILANEENDEHVDQFMHSLMSYCGHELKNCKSEILEQRERHELIQMYGLSSVEKKFREESYSKEEKISYLNSLLHQLLTDQSTLKKFPELYWNLEEAKDKLTKLQFVESNGVFAQDWPKNEVDFRPDIFRDKSYLLFKKWMEEINFVPNKHGWQVKVAFIYRKLKEYKYLDCKQRVFEDFIQEEYRDSYGELKAMGKFKSLKGMSDEYSRLFSSLIKEFKASQH